ncbi:MAG: acyl-phosphate glycerol 3-phosphate acyltransferase [Pseudoduganella sp.]|jgi:1-acyl-sn-glycerol-3-phosphate acyltransferase|nr:acyl-phosphate glycerol 3-phosphate acyltransferase [Pseudoduganella sp.]
MEAKQPAQRNLDWRLALRCGRMALHLVAGMATCALVFPFIGKERRNAHIRRWSRQLLAICNVSVQVAHGSAQPLEHGVIVCNHISWLDIFVINALYPCRFVAKAEIRDWPLAGWLVAQAGTVFIARGNKRELRNIFKGLVHALQEGQRVAFFPEGTTAAQGTILPFHANLFEAAVDGKVQVQPFALSYVDAAGQPHPSVDFIGDMTFVQSVVNILDGKPVRARLAVLPAMEGAGAHRRELAQAAHDAIAGALGIVPAAQTLQEHSA